MLSLCARILDSCAVLSRMMNDQSRLSMCTAFTVLVNKSDDLAQKVASRELVKETLGALHR